jgi:hypothetical protein
LNQLPFLQREQSRLLEKAAKRFQVALSFAGAQRAFVARVAELLAADLGRDRVLFDAFHQAELARARLAFYLQQLYSSHSDLIVAIFSQDYEVKEWCGLEWDSIFALIKQGREQQVMLCRFDRIEPEGLQGLAGFVELDGLDAQEAARLILQRLALNKHDLDPQPGDGQELGVPPASDPGGESSAPEPAVSAANAPPLRSLPALEHSLRPAPPPRTWAWAAIIGSGVLLLAVVTIWAIHVHPSPESRDEPTASAPPPAPPGTSPPSDTRLACDFDAGLIGAIAFDLPGAEEPLVVARQELCTKYTLLRQLPQLGEASSARSENPFYRLTIRHAEAERLLTLESTRLDSQKVSFQVAEPGSNDSRSKPRCYGIESARVELVGDAQAPIAAPVNACKLTLTLPARSWGGTLRFEWGPGTRKAVSIGFDANTFPVLADPEAMREPILLEATPRSSVRPPPKPPVPPTCPPECKLLYEERKRCTTERGGIGSGPQKVCVDQVEEELKHSRCPPCR